LYGIYEEASGGEVDPNVEDTGENGRVGLKVDTGSGVSTEAELGGSLETGYVVESIDDPLGIFPEGTVQGDFLELGTVEVILKSLAAGEWGYPGLYSSRRVNSAGSHRKVLYPISELSFIQSKLLYHGTPNKVGEAGNFSTEFVGAGEGAQVYGWGLYFAENRKISEDFYQKRLSDSGSRYFYKGKLLKDTDYEGSGKLAYLVVRCLARYSDDKRSAVLQDIRERFLVWAEGVRSRAEAFFSQSDPGNFWSGKFFPDPRYQSAFKFSVNFSVGDVSWSPEEGVQAVQSELQQLQEFLDSFDVLAIRKEKPAQRGYTYTVDLKVPDDLFIDWDKTWEGQPGAVRNRLLKAKTPVTRDSVRAWIRSRVAIGGQFLTFLYEEMGGKKTKFGDKEIAKAEAMDLRKTGIHGVRYLDGNSRRSGEGSHNYVIYDESDIETVLHPEKYDQGQMGLFTQEEMVIPSKVSASFRRVNSGASPGDHIELRFTSVDGSSDKFINMDYSGGNTFTATWGKFGTAGRQTEYPVAEWDAYYRGKTRKGYTDVTGGGDVVPQVRKAPPRKPPASVQAPVRKADPLGEWRQPDLFSSRRQQISDRFFIGR
jgi:predicted DNA-binding WGR domain protein